MGATLLHRPELQAQGALRWIDCLFVSTSAICVTGLVPVRGLAEALGPAGEALLLGLIQLGGLGVVLVAFLLLRAAGRRFGPRQAAALADTYGEPSSSVRSFLVHVVGATLAVEAVGALLLWIRWRDLPDGAWQALFHSVSAFCNAGFSTFAHGLADQRADRLACSVVALLFVLGGLGFPVLAELGRWVRRRRSDPFVLSLHSRTVLISSGILLAIGFVGLLPATSRLAGDEGALAACFDAAFHSASARTAGFDVLAIGELGAPALLVLCLLMTIGASPGSTGGGIKTVTFVVFWRRVVAQVRGDPEDTLLGRSLFEPQVRQAIAITSVYVTMLGLLIFALTLLLPEVASGGPGLLAVLFEACSALGTVGYTTGLTPDLPDPAKLLLVVAMIAGRVGPITIIYLLAGTSTRVPYRFPRERVFLS